MSGTFSLKMEPQQINGHKRDWMCFLMDGACPEWVVFVKTFANKSDARKRRFAGAQERAQKDTECAFGAMVSHFHVLKKPLHGWCVEDLTDTAQCCGMPHNMIMVEHPGAVTDEEELVANAEGFALFGHTTDTVDLFAARVSKFDDNRQNPCEHFLLKHDLAEHINDV